MDYAQLTMGLLIPAMVFLLRGYLFDLIGLVSGHGRRYWKSRRVDIAVVAAFLAIEAGVVLVVEVPSISPNIGAVATMFALLMIAGLSASAVQEEWARNRSR